MTGNHTFQRIGVVGGGAWGVALACTAQRAGAHTMVVTRRHQNAADLRKGQCQRLPDSRFPPLPAEASYEPLAQCDAVIIACPAQNVRAALTEAKNHIQKGTPVALGAKGIEQHSLCLPSDMLAEIIPSSPVAIISGPSFAVELVAGLPTAVTLACPDASIAAAWVASLRRPELRLYAADDIVGAQIGGVVKNVLAIACGTVEGMNLGHSAQAALMARGFSEMMRFGIALGSSAETMTGLSGLGDLALTCFSPLSRNRRFGIAVGQGMERSQALTSVTGVVEGVHSAAALVQLAGKKGVAMPVSEAVAATVAGNASVGDAIEALLSRPTTREFGHSQTSVG